MKKIIIWLGLVILLLGGGFTLLHGTTNSAQPQPARPSSTKVKRHNVSPKLTVNALQHNRKLAYSAIIYFAIKHSQLQRWQEVSDFSLGWQVESYPHKGQTKYLVWPDQHIQDSAKNLAPNWFRLTDQQHVLYDSMIVHSFRKDQTKTASLAEIVRQINADHATAKVRRMPQKMTIVTH